MRRFLIVSLLALIGLMPFTASAQSPVQAPTPAKTDLVYPLVLAAGALAGVVAVNALTHSVGTLPLTTGIVSTAPFVSPAAAAASRIFVITSGIMGAWVASWIYGK